MTKAAIKRAKAERALFTRRTYTMYRHQCERADKAGMSVPYSLEELRSEVEPYLFAPWGPDPTTCRHCGERLKAKTFSLDHDVPIERGGIWDLSNLHVICDRCNRAKGIMSGAEFESVLRVLREMPTATRNDTLGRLRAGGAMRRLVLTKRRVAA
jgi:5-methylcytosine-specific restriction endonuclease McrA